MPHPGWRCIGEFRTLFRHIRLRWPSGPFLRRSFSLGYRSSLLKVSSRPSFKQRKSSRVTGRKSSWGQLSRTSLANWDVDPLIGIRKLDFYKGPSFQTISSTGPNCGEPCNGLQMFRTRHFYSHYSLFARSKGILNH